MENQLHNWLYSFLPASIQPYFYNKPHNEVLTTKMYLLGYCKNCRTSFSEEVKIGNELSITNMSFPRYGCKFIDDVAEALSGGA